MTQLRIDEHTVTVPPDTTVLEAAASVGIEIPTLCYRTGLPHYTSCMLCVVRDQASDQFIPSCSATVSEGMLIETDSEAVREARRVALELLLSDHVGDCIAPCQRACPAGIPIPRILRRIAAADAQAAGQTLGAVAETCRACAKENTPPPCERACRRAQRDESVAIAALCRFAALPQPPAPQPRTTTKHRDTFNSAMGRIRDEEWPALMQGVSDIHRVLPQAGTQAAYRADEAIREAARCMHCDCRAPDTCKLREYATRYGAKRTRFRTSERRIFEHDLSHAEIIFEQGKCISCGICIRVAAEQHEPLGLCFTGRGIETRLSVPLAGTLADGLRHAAAACVTACPTGALAFRDEPTEDQAS